MILALLPSSGWSANYVRVVNNSVTDYVRHTRMRRKRRVFCLPDIISEKIELSFEDELDYSEFSLYFSVKDVIELG